MVMRLSAARAGSEGVITGIAGDHRFLSRVTALGLTPGCHVAVLLNQPRRPMLLYARDTLLAINRGDCGLIEIEPKEARA